MKKYWPHLLAGAGVLAVTAIVGLNIYHAQYTLTRERLDVARQRWEAANIRDYDIVVTVHGGTTGVYRVHVRHGKAVDGTQNDQPFETMEKAYYWTMAGLLDFVLENDLTNDAKTDGGSAYTQAWFDPNDGHLVRYLRSKGKQNIIMDVKLSRVT